MHRGQKYVRKNAGFYRVTITGTNFEDKGAPVTESQKMVWWIPDHKSPADPENEHCTLLSNFLLRFLPLEQPTAETIEMPKENS